MSRDSSPSLPVKESTGIRTDLKTIVLVLLSVTGAAVAVGMFRANTAGQGEKLGDTAAIVRADHDTVVTHTAQIDQLTKALDRMDKKLDYLTGARAERPPAGTK